MAVCQEEPSSSTGRRRSGRKGVIPAPGEDETSEEDEDSDDSDDSAVDEKDITESDRCALLVLNFPISTPLPLPSMELCYTSFEQRHLYTQ